MRNKLIIVLRESDALRYEHVSIFLIIGCKQSEVQIPQGPFSVEVLIQYEVLFHVVGIVNVNTKLSVQP